MKELEVLYFKFKHYVRHTWLAQRWLFAIGLAGELGEVRPRLRLVSKAVEIQS
jgi:hypothetical protein